MSLYLSKIANFGALSTRGIAATFFTIARPQITPTENHVVFITGCDSGLGYNMALNCHSYGLTVFAGCHNAESVGANKLKDQLSSSGQSQVIELDIEDNKSIKTASEQVRHFLDQNKSKKFYGLINNAGVMAFGEFEWQTELMFTKQINVNILGTMKTTHAFLPLLRQHKGRIINVSSHCSMQALPGLAPYSSSKAALQFFTEALRNELKKYGVDVVSFIPGSFVGQSNIASRQMEYAKVMRAAFTPEQLRFYGTYFDTYNGYLSALSGYRVPNAFEDDGMMKTFQNALFDKNPKLSYKYEPWNYKMYYFLFRIAPTEHIRDTLIKKFLAMPVYKSIDCE